MAHSRKYLASEASHNLKRTGRYAGGIAARGILRLVTAVGATLAGASGSVGYLYSAGLLGVSTGVGLQAYLNHKDFEHSKEQLANMYRKEMSAYFVKDGKEITVDDIERLAKINPSIDEHIDRERTKRNVRTGIWMVAGALGFAAAAAVIATGSIGIVAGIAGFATFQVARPIVKKLGEDTYKLNEATTVELIKGLEAQRTRGLEVSQVQVMETFVSASKALDETIRKQYGQEFSNLGIGDKHRVLLQHGSHFMLDEVTEAINQNRLNARELTFRIHDDISGAYPDPSYKDQWSEGLSHVKGKAFDLKQNMVSGARNLHQNAVSSVRNFVSSEAAAAPEQEAVSTKFRDAENARRAVSTAGPQLQ